MYQAFEKDLDNSSFSSENLEKKVLYFHQFTDFESFFGSKSLFQPRIII